MTRLLLSFLLLTYCVQGTAQATDTTKVLFVGNSYTYFWNLPQVVEAMAVEQGIPLVTRQSTAGGANLGHHHRSARNLNTLSKIENGDWDVVVLQDHSLRAIQAKDSLHYYISWWNNFINQQNAISALYMTWARKFNPLMTQQISKGYESVGEKENIPVVPVGRIWAKARKLRPDLILYDDDGSHPAPLGTYLTACAFYRFLTDRSPVGLPSRLISSDKNGEKLYLIIVPPGDASFCQNVVDSVFDAYKFD